MVSVNPGDAFEANVGGPISPACNASDKASYVAAATFMIDRFRRSLIV